MNNTPLTVILATGGTGGHIFPAEAVAELLIERGHKPILVTDKRFESYSSQSASALSNIPIHFIPASMMNGAINKKLYGAAKNGVAFIKARKIISRIKPDIVVGFGGYPSFPTMLAAAGKYPTIIHEQNALLGKANRVLSNRVDVIASSFSSTDMLHIDDVQRVETVGNPVRSAIKALRGIPYPHLQSDGIMHVLITGGSQGASIFGNIVPEAIALLPETLRRRLRIDQQVRAEQIDTLRQTYHRINVQAELMPFFSDIPTRLASAHLVIARSGASTVAELTCAGRPAILVPLPNSADDHQVINARALDDAGGGWLMPQDAFSPEALAARLESFLNLPATLQRAASEAQAIGNPNAASTLADLIEQTARP